jgi:hypothetical protein
MSKRTLKEISLDLLEQYMDAKEDLIWEYSGSIGDDTKRLEEEVAIIRQEIEEADDVKTGTAKIVTNGNCCVCGEPLDNGLFLCKKCAGHTESDHE